MSSSKKVVNKIFDILSTIVIVLLVICLLSNFQTTLLGKKYNSFFGYALFEVKTGSMSPAIDAGDWIIVKVDDDVAVNDIVTFEQDGVIITHRIIESFQDTFVTMGDANNAKDATILRSQIIGKVVKILPRFSIIKKTILNEKVLILLFLVIVAFYSLFNKDSLKIVQIFGNKESKKESKKVLEDEKKIIENIEEAPVSSKTTLLSKVNVNYGATNINELLSNKDTDDDSKEEVNNEEVNDENVLEDGEVEEPTVEEENEPEQIVEEEVEDDGNLDIVMDKTRMSRKKYIEQFVEEADRGDYTIVNDPNYDGDKKKRVPDIEVGKFERNIVKKNLDLKRNQMKSYFDFVVGNTEKNKPFTKIINNFIEQYVNDMYIRQGDSKTTDDLIKQTKIGLDEIREKLLSKAKNNEQREEVLYADKIIRYALDIEMKDDIKSIDALFNDESLKIKDRDKAKNQLLSSNNKYKVAYKSLNKVVSSNKLYLSINKISDLGIYNTTLNSNITFSKIYSDYIINKTYEESLIIEYLKEAQLTLLSNEISQNMLALKPLKKYMIYLPDSLYAKPKKLLYSLKIVGDEYSQSKVLLVVDNAMIEDFYTVIHDLKTIGFNFVLETTLDEIKELDLSEYKLLVSYILLVTGKEQVSVRKYATKDFPSNRFMTSSKTCKTGVKIK